MRVLEPDVKKCCDNARITRDIVPRALPLRFYFLYIEGGVEVGVVVVIRVGEPAVERRRGARRIDEERRGPRPGVERRGRACRVLFYQTCGLRLDTRDPEGKLRQRAQDFKRLEVAFKHVALGGKKPYLFGHDDRSDNARGHAGLAAHSRDNGLVLP